MIYYPAHIKFLLFAILFFGTAAAEVFAAEGDLDPTFDGDGIIITDNNLNEDSIRDLAVQPDGKIIAVGISFVPSFTSRQAVIVRYLPNGSIDSTFGTSGKVIIPSVSLEESALQTNGKIVLVGHIGTSPNTDLYVVRLNSDGSFDTTFNGTGALTLDLRGTFDSATSVKIQPDEKIVVSVSAFQPDLNFPRGDFAIVRFNADGSLDATFDGDGKVFTPLQENAVINTLAIQPDGKIVAAGEAFLTEASSGNPIGSFATTRYNSDGSVDTTFNGGVAAFTQFSLNPSPGGTRNNRPETVLIRTGGKILVVGTTRSCCGPQPLSQVAMIQYNADGSLDSSFGTAGKTQFGFSTFAATSARDAAIQADNKIVITGTTQPNIKAPLQAVVGRFNANGSLDPTFSGDGWNTLQFPTGISSSGSAVAIQPDGKILIGGGRSISGISQDFLIARFEASSCRTANCSGEKQKVADFDGDGRTDLSVFRDGTWFINPSGANNPNSFYGVQFGLPTDKLTPTDFDGDGKTDIAVYREGTWYWIGSSNNQFNAFQFGLANDIPVPADFTADGRAELAVYRGGVWYTLNLANNQFQAVQFGLASDKPVPADFDADGKTDFAVYRDGIWYILGSSQGFAAVQFGIATDKPVVGDYDGDGRADQAVYRAGIWYILGSTQGFYAVQFGIATDIPVPADYDGDGKTDIAVFRDGIWYLLRSQQGFGAVQFGMTNDRPIPAAFVP